MDSGKSDRKAFHSRTGSHATKARATGEQLMPTPRFTDFEPMTQRYITGRQTLADLLIRLATLNDKLIMDMSHGEYERLQAERDRIAAEAESLKGVVRSLKESSRRMREHGKVELFRRVAFSDLPPDLFRAVEEKADRLWQEEQKAAERLLSLPNPLDQASEVCGRIRSKAKKRREQRQRQRTRELMAQKPRRYRR